MEKGTGERPIVEGHGGDVYPVAQGWRERACNVGRREVPIPTLPSPDRLQTLVHRFPLLGV